MLPFDKLFLEQARRDLLLVETDGPRRSTRKIVFLEYYCELPGCDCRRVELEVVWIEEQLRLGWIGYWFDKQGGAPQVELVPHAHQSREAPTIRALFEGLVRDEPGIRAQLLEHYAMWKTAVADGRLQKPPRKPKQPRVEKAPAGTIGLVLAKSARADGKLQQKFRKLLEKVERLRGRVRQWKEQRPDIDRELAEYFARCDELARERVELVRVLDRVSRDANVKLTKAERRALSLEIGDLAAQLLDEVVGKEPGLVSELKEIYGRHTRQDFDAQTQLNVELMKDVLLRETGLDLREAQVSSFEELRAAAEQQLRTEEAEQEARRQERAARRKKSAKQVASEQRKAGEQRDAEKAVQEVYRALARAWHPDRELDEVERARKAELMREVNIAYEAKDLLRLLELQLQLEAVSDEGVEAMAEARVTHFVRILDAQAKQLGEELALLEGAFRAQLQRASFLPADVIARVRRDAEEVQNHIESMRTDREAFAEPANVKAWLKRSRDEAW